MKVKINKILCGKPNSREEQAADALIANLNTYFKDSNVSGEICILINPMIYRYLRNEIDIVVVGALKDFYLTFNSQYKTRNCATPFDEKTIKVEVEDFCFILEHKQQTFDALSNGMHGVKIDNTRGVIVYYPSTGDIENATAQAKTQADGLHTKFVKSMGMSPFIVPMIWLENVTSKPSYVNREDAPNVLYGNFSMKELFEAACTYNVGYMPFMKSNGAYILSNKYCQPDAISKIIKQASEKPQIKGNITRKRLEMITNDVLNVKLKDLQYEKGILVWEGKAGTGKTSALLRIAHLLKEEEDARCMILTYNRALVGDLSRTFAFLGVSYRPDGETIDVSTMQSFFIEIMEACGITKPKYGKTYLKQYSNGLNALLDYINSNVLDDDEISKIKRDKFHLSWDYVLVDEGQDWSDEEKAILLKFFADGHLIVADGVDQIVRPGGKHQNWTLGRTRSEYEKKKYDVGLRQFSVLTDFNVKFAELRNYDWVVKKNTIPESKGGNIVILPTQTFVNQMQRKMSGILNNCISAGNEAYDVMMLVPYQYAKTDANGNSVLCQELSSKFEFAQINYFDGINDKEREDYPLDEVRVFQYESCRGLEAWTTVCLDFDVFLKNKEGQYVDKPQPNVANSPQDRLNEYLSAWAMMPLTRPINTLIITISDPNCEIAKQLKEVARFYEQECYI